MRDLSLKGWSNKRPCIPQIMHVCCLPGASVSVPWFPNMKHGDCKSNYLLNNEKQIRNFELASFVNVHCAYFGHVVLMITQKLSAEIICLFLCLYVHLSEKSLKNGTLSMSHMFTEFAWSLEPSVQQVLSKHSWYNCGWLMIQQSPSKIWLLFYKPHVHWGKSMIN